MSIQPPPARLERRKLHNPLFALVILKFTVLHISVFCLPNLLSMQNKMGIKICLTGWDTCLHREVNQLCGMMWRDMICYGGLYIVHYCATGIRVLDVQRQPGENESHYPTMTRHVRPGYVCMTLQSPCIVGLCRSNSIAILYRATRTRARAAESQLTCANFRRRPCVCYHC